MDIKISQLNNVASAELTDLFEISRLAGGTYESNSITYRDLLNSVHGARTIPVSQMGTGEFSTIKEALAYAATIAGPTNSVVLLVSPGTYIEDNPLVIPSYVSIKSYGGQFTTAVGSANNGIVFQMGYRSIIQGLSIQATVSAGAIGSTGIYSTQQLNVIEDCVFVNLENAVWADGPTADSTVVLDCAVLNFTTAKVTRGFYATNGSKFVVKTSLTNSSNSSNLIDYGLYSDASNMYVSGFNFSECDIAAYCNNGGEIEINSSYIYDGTNGLVIGPDGINSKIHATGVNIEDSVSGNHVQIDSVSGHLDLIGAYQSYKRAIVSGAEFHSLAQDASWGGASIIGDTKVENRFDIGFPAKKEIGVEIGVDIGTGKAYSSDRFGGDVVEYWTYDSSAASGSRFTRLDNNSGTILTDDGDALIVGSRYDFSSLLLDVLQPMDPGTTSIISEHWNGSSWVEHDVATYEKFNFIHRANSFFQNVETQYVEHGIEVFDDWDRGYNELDEIPSWDLGVDMYPVRFRNNGSSLVTPAIIRNGQVKSDNFSIQASGEATSWGINREQETLYISAFLWDSDRINPPSLIDINVSSNLTLAAHPSFLDSSVCKSVLSTVIPLWVDTSTPLEIAIDGLPSNSNGGDLSLVFYVVNFIENEISGNFDEEIYSGTFTVPSFTNKSFRIKQKISIQNYSPGQTLLIGVERNATVSNPLDTFAGDWTTIGSALTYYRKIIG